MAMAELPKRIKACVAIAVYRAVTCRASMEELDWWHVKVRSVHEYSSGNIYMNYRRHFALHVNQRRASPPL